MRPEESRDFEGRQALSDWLAHHHETATSLWVRIWKKGSGRASVTWEDCVVAALCWGWIDGLKKRGDDLHYFQRLTPRRGRSVWSKRNRTHVEALIQEGLMAQPGLAQVAAAQADGRWDAAYEGSATMKIPDDFLAALHQEPAAVSFYATLDRKNLYAIYYRLQSAKREETRQKRIREFVARLARGERFF